MSFNEILTNIFIALGIGSILALMIRFYRERDKYEWNKSKIK